MGGLGSPYGQPGHHSPNGGGSVSSKRSINRSEWESRCLWLSVLPFRSANYPSGSVGLPAAISPKQSYVSCESAAGYKLPTLPKHAVLGEHALVVPPDDHPTQAASAPDSILAPQLLTTR